MIEQIHAVLERIEHGWPELRVMVVGDVMLDRYIRGEVSRISPEAPVPVVRATHQSEQPGGAANVAMNLARLGARVTLAGFTGGDENERALRALLARDGIDSVFLADEDYPTITKLRILGGSQQMLRLDSERQDGRPAAHAQRLLEAVEPQLASCDAVILSDYAKGVLTAETCQPLIRAARQRGIPVLVDPKSADFSRYRGATTICPNLGELSAAVRAKSPEEAGSLESMLHAGQGMVAEFELDFLTATLSEKGIALVGRESVQIDPAQARQVFDVSGAGDTAIAVLTLGLAAGLDPFTAIQLANLAAGIVVGKVGTVPIEKHELLAALTPAIGLHAAEKVVSRSELKARVAAWRANGERVAFTNGCFDLLHVGHITVLEKSRQTADRLIVAINSDDSVKRLKGPSRPIVGERERARVLSALGCVDAVAVFDEDTPLELILAVRPDILVKGGDYSVETVVGATEIAAWGGQVRIVPTVEGYSTTRLIERGAGKQDDGK